MRYGPNAAITKMYQDLILKEIEAIENKHEDELTDSDRDRLAELGKALEIAKVPSLANR